MILVEEGTGERTILWDRDPKIRVSPEDLPHDDIRGSRALLLDGQVTWLMLSGGALILAGVVFTERADPVVPAAGPGPEIAP